MTKSPIEPSTDAIPMTKKDRCREKEQRRAQNINAAFHTLQTKIPFLREEERHQLPKIKTLRLAMKYIQHLNSLLEGDKMYTSDTEEARPLQHNDFRAEVSSEMRIRNSYRERAHLQEMDKAVVNRILAREGQKNQQFQLEMEMYNVPDVLGQSYMMNNQNAYNFRQMANNNFSPAPNSLSPHSSQSSSSPINYNFDISQGEYEDNAGSSNFSYQ